jgi:hypothetical protein
MHRTFNSLRLFIAATALLLALLAAPVALAWVGEPAAPDQLAVGLSTAFFVNFAAEWHDNADNEDGFTVEWWMKIKGKWVLQATYTSPPSTPPDGYGWQPVEASRGWNRYRVRAYNANGVSAWSNWADLTIK